MLQQYKKMKTLYKKYERALIPSALVLGFLVDVFTFRSIEVDLAFIILGIHLVIAGSAIVYINAYDRHWQERPGKVRGYIRLAAPLLMQFSFGALLSAAFIFYSFGGSLAVSWPLLVIILFLMLSNEFFKQYYLKVSVQIGVFFFSLFSVFSLVLPFTLKSISPFVFVGSGILALVIIALYIRGLARIVSGIAHKQFGLTAIVAIIFGVMHVFYFANIIPPIPLTLRDAGVYHNVVRVGGDYQLTTEKESLVQKFVPGKTIHTTPNGAVYVFSAIFAPAELDTSIVHHWQRYDRDAQSWVTTQKVSYALVGGREAGYRGFSLTNRTVPGQYRVFVETERGQVIGTVRFTVDHIDELPIQEIIIQ